MMTADVVKMAPAGRSRDWPLLVPRALFLRYQPLVGAAAAMLWLNLYEMAEGGVDTEFVSVATALGARMGISPEETEAGARKLEEAGLLHRSGGRWTVLWPAETSAEPPSAPEIAAVGDAAGQAPVDTATDGAPPPDEDGDEDEAAQWNTDEAALQAVVQFYHQRIGMLGPSQFEKLRFWVEEQGVSPDVVALAIEETVQSAQTPRMAYVEGVLRNWYNDGIRTVADLQQSKRSRSHEVTPTAEGTPNAAAFDAVDRDAVRRWKEMYSDEYAD